MITREDMRFATCFQLAQMIAADWDNWPAAVLESIKRLSYFDDPNEPISGAGLNGMAFGLKLKSYEVEPESINNAKRLLILLSVVKDLRVILGHSDGWQTELSEKFKKELNLRINEYENQTKQITTEEPARCEIKL